jgi:hypothetical protein
MPEATVAAILQILASLLAAYKEPPVLRFSRAESGLLALDLTAVILTLAFVVERRRSYRGRRASGEVVSGNHSAPGDPRDPQSRSKTG